jgi:UDPglucose 6-dehydrogenase
MNICVQGLWHLGSVTAACLAARGHNVCGLERDEAVVAGLVQGRAPIAEPGLDDLLREGLDAGRLRFSADAATALAGCELLWVAFDTPVDEDDNADVDFVVESVARVLPLLPTGVTVLVSSQLPVGSVARLEKLAAASCPGKGLGFACSPENLRLGKAISVFLEPDRVILGLRAGTPHEARLRGLFATIAERVEVMGVESAEMTKHAINAFLALSVAFANEIATVCEAAGADAKEVERGLKSEQRIGPGAYLSPGGAFAGGTLARDIAFLSRAGDAAGLPLSLVRAVKRSNDEHKLWPRRTLAALCPGFPRVRVAVWGLTYKPGTDTLRRSMAVELARWLLAQGAELAVHDPAVRELPPELAGARRAASPLEALAGASALVVCTKWPEYRAVDPAAVAQAAPGLLVVDADRFLAHLAEAEGVMYRAVGTPQK